MEKIAKKPTLLSMLFGNNVDGVKIEDTESTYVESDYIASLKNGVLTPLKSENKKSSKKSGFSEGLSKFESTIDKMKEQRGKSQQIEVVKDTSSKENEENQL